MINYENYLENYFSELFVEMIYILHRAIVRVSLIFLIFASLVTRNDFNLINIADEPMFE